jgi:hypothetical protein
LADAYQLVLAETNTIALFKCIEVAQATLLMRRDALENRRNCDAEQEAIADALNHLRQVKRVKVKFGW